MKKGLILIFTVLVWSSGLMAQAVQKDVRSATSYKDVAAWKNRADVVVETPVIPILPYPGVAGVNAVSKTQISSSANVWTAIVAESNCLTADQELGAILYTTRAGGSFGHSGNDLKFLFSTDLGLNFDNIVISSPTQMHRYPSGALYNPVGNTNIQGAFAGFAGPSHLGTGWTHWYTGSVGLDSNNINTNYDLIHGGSFDQHFVRYGMQSCDGGYFHVVGLDSIGTEFQSMSMNNGVFNASTNTVDWTQVAIPHDLLNDTTDGSDVFNIVNTAWSQDGSVGYAYIIGVDSLDPNMATQPITYKSTDHGLTWSQMAAFDFTTLPEIMTNLNNWWGGVLGYTGTPRINFCSWFSGHDAVVDANGDLHMYVLVQCGFGTTYSQDSLGYIYTNEPKILYDIYTTSSGWSARVIDTILTSYVKAEDSGFGSGADAMGWDHRIQASRSYDGTKLFCTWTDTDTTMALNNMFPDIKVYGYDILSGYKTGVVNFTKGTLYDGFNYFHYTSNLTLKQGTTYTIPMTTIQTGADPSSPIIHEYTSGITFEEADFVPNPGIDEQDNFGANIKLYPNPVEDICNIEIDLKEASNLTLSVFNSAGQVVSQKSFGMMKSGNQLLTIDLKSLNTGFYMIRLQAGTSAVNLKTIVK